MLANNQFALDDARVSLIATMFAYDHNVDRGKVALT
jgi:hypothetical protein